MGSLAIAFLQSTPQITMKSALLVLAFAAYVQAGQWIYVEDPQEQHMRIRRSPQEELAQGAPLRYAPAPLAPSYDQYEADQSVAGSTAYAKPHKGRVGPVYTFVKTDPKANFKWGVSSCRWSSIRKIDHHAKKKNY